MLTITSSTLRECMVMPMRPRCGSGTPLDNTGNATNFDSCKGECACMRMTKEAKK